MSRPVAQMRYDWVVSRFFRIVRIAVLALLSSIALLAIILWAGRFLPAITTYPIGTIWVSNSPWNEISQIAIQHGDRDKGNHRRVGAEMSNGRISIFFTWTSEEIGWTGSHWILGTGEVSWWQNSSKNGSKTICAQYPIAFVIAVLGAYTLLSLRRAIVRRYKRRKPNECLNCAYDLTGNISGTCPECGTIHSALTTEARQTPDFER